MGPCSILFLYGPLVAETLVFSYHAPVKHMFYAERKQKKHVTQFN